MMFIYKTAKLIAPVWTTIFKIRAIFVHQPLTEHALLLLLLSGYQFHHQTSPPRDKPRDTTQRGQNLPLGTIIVYNYPLPRDKRRSQKSHSQKS